jgi:hypothetical protein
VALRGHVDQVTHHYVSGWAYQNSNPTEAVTIVVKVNGESVGAARANAFREDLKALGPEATGKYGFQFNFDPSLSLFADHEIEVKFDAASESLANGRQVLPGISATPVPLVRSVPILISALGRSGTSLLMSRLAVHSDITIAGSFPYETKMLSYFSLALRTLISEGDREQSTNPDTMSSEEERFHIGFNPFNHPEFSTALGGQPEHEQFFHQYLPMALGERFRDVILEYYEFVRVANKKLKVRYFAEKVNLDITSRTAPRFMFGMVKEILLIRDPRDVLCSAVDYWGVPVEQAIETIANASETVAGICDENRKDTMLVRYEDLVMREEETLQAIATFLDLERIHARSKEFDSQAFSRHATSAAPYKSVGRWKEDLTEDLIRKSEGRFVRTLEYFHY